MSRRTDHPSAAVIADVARQAQVGQLASIETLDAKASALIGFAGVVLGLVFTSSAADNWNNGLTAGVSALLLAVVALGVGLLPRRYKRNPNVLGLRRGYLNRDPAITNLAIIDSIEAALLYNVDVVRWKIRAIHLGTFFVVLGIVVLSASLIYSVTNTAVPSRAPVQKGRLK